MRRIAAVLLLALPACGSPAKPPPPEPEVVEIEEQNARRDADRRGPLGIRESQLPPVGECRLWLPGRPTREQRPPGDCGDAERDAPPGSWILYRPPEDRRVVHVRVMDPVRRGVIGRVDLYDAERETYLGTKEIEKPPPAADVPPAEVPPAEPPID